jgi:hypothetical protein
VARNYDGSLRWTMNQAASVITDANNQLFVGSSKVSPVISADGMIITANSGYNNQSIISSTSKTQQVSESQWSVKVNG